MMTTSFPRFQGDPAGIFIYHLSWWLSKKGIQVEVISPYDYGSQYSEVREDIRIHRFSYFYPPRFQRLCYKAGILQNLKEDKFAAMQLPSFILSELFYSLWITKKRQFDVIHAHWSLPQGLIGIICKMFYKIPCVTTVHGSDIYGLKSPLFKALNAKVIKYSDVCTANSTATAKVVEEIGERRHVEIIPMGTNKINLVRNFPDVDKVKRELGIDGRVVLFVGRLIEVKGPEYLMRAIPLVLEKCHDVSVLMIGAGPQKDYLVNLSRDMKLEGKVIFLDSIPPEELVKFYSIASLLVLPSVIIENGETEGLGMVLLEAMACKVPVIGSNVGGIPDIIKDGKTGLLVKQKDSDDIAEKIITLLTNEDLRNTVIENGFTLVEEHFSWDLIADRFKEIYLKVVRK
ncbi:MAG: glycosyltransferase [Thermodesulfobacteriota bacterium]|nr:glycosyltransferase [Thermodesulfobacteriota bacterium]